LESTHEYWNEVFEDLRRHPQPTWRAYCDAVHGALISRWWSGTPKDRLLKTDLYEEAMGDGLSSCLQGCARQVFGMDCSSHVAAVAGSRSNGLRSLAADVRQLPFGAATFDGVISISTLDHFVAREDLIRGLHEIARVMCPGGLLILTLDNLANPLIRLRQWLPFRFLNRLGIVPYYVGYTCDAKGLQGMLIEAGFDLLETSTVSHCPRVLVVPLARWADRRGKPQTRARLCRILMRFERLADWATRFRTGNFIAVKAVKG
jgi:SAM-dependent methyltransferase